MDLYACYYLNQIFKQNLTFNCFTVFGFLFLVFIILMITCSETTILLCYFHLCSEVIPVFNIMIISINIRTVFCKTVLLIWLGLPMVVEILFDKWIHCILFVPLLCPLLLYKTEY